MSALISACFVLADQLLLSHPCRELPGSPVCAKVVLLRGHIRGGIYVHIGHIERKLCRQSATQNSALQTGSISDVRHQKNKKTGPHPLGTAIFQAARAAIYEKLKKKGPLSRLLL